MRDHVRICGSPGRATDRGDPAKRVPAPGCVAKQGNLEKMRPADPLPADLLFERWRRSINEHSSDPFRTTSFPCFAWSHTARTLRAL